MDDAFARIFVNVPKPFEVKLPPEPVVTLADVWYSTAADPKQPLVVKVASALTAVLPPPAVDFAR